MRKHLLWFLVLAISASAVAVAWARTDTSTSSATISVTPQKLSKKNFKKAKLKIETSTINNTNGGTPTNPSTQPAIVSKVTLGFDNDIKFNTKGVPTCNPKDVAGTTTGGAKAICGKAQIGQGSATACFSGGGLGSPCGAILPVVVTAFNGKPQGGNPTIILHSRVDSGAIHTTQVLVGVLKGGGKGDYSKNLVVTVPPIAATALTDFRTTVGKAFTVKGKKVNYVEARCKDKNKELNMTYDFKYSTAGEDEDKGKTFSKCTR
jgi:hypothetical protein